jgi:hypothetical protein
MDKFNAGICVFFGALLIYISIFGLSFGLSDFGLSLMTGFTDNFDDNTMNSQWAVPGNVIYQARETGGRLLCKGTGYGGTGYGEGYVTVNSYNLANGYVSVDWAVTSGIPTLVLLVSTQKLVAEDPNGVTFSVRMERESTVGLIAMYSQAGKVQYVPVNSGRIDTSMPTSGKMKIAFSSGTIQFYANSMDTPKITWAAPYTDFSSMYVSLWCSLDIGEVAWDNFVLNTGGGDGGAKGTLNVYASYDGKPVVVTVNIKGPETTSGITHSDGTALSFLLTTGTYEISGTYNDGKGNIVRTDSKTVSTTGSVDSKLDFGGPNAQYTCSTCGQKFTSQATLDEHVRTAHGGTTQPDIWEKIRGVVESKNGKTIELLAGLVLLGGGGIVLIKPKKKPAASTSPT